jgi:hypothetical protein
MLIQVAPKVVAHTLVRRLSNNSYSTRATLNPAEENIMATSKIVVVTEASMATIEIGEVGREFMTWLETERRTAQPEKVSIFGRFTRLFSNCTPSQQQQLVV